MRKYLGRTAAKAGKPPGTLVTVGHYPAERSRSTIIYYTEHGFQREEAHSLEQVGGRNALPGVCWMNTTGLGDVEWIRKTGEIFGLHPLAIEDILNTHQRPKLDDFGDHFFITLRMAVPNGSGQLALPQLSLVLGKDWVLTFLEQPSEALRPIEERVCNGHGRIRAYGADHLAYSIIDSVVDHYMVLLERLADQIETTEEEIIQGRGARTIERLHEMKMALLLLRKAVWPLRELIPALQRRQGDLIRAETEFYLRDLLDHVIRVGEDIELYRAMIDGLMTLHLSRASYSMNEVMKVLTIIATIFIPLTFIVGVYGMNFKYMPELDVPWAYPAVWGLMLLITAGLIVFFRKRKWL